MLSNKAARAALPPQPKPNDEAVRADSWRTDRVISHDEAREIATRLINSHFRKEPCARVGIPARPDYDDDLLICTYIEQQKEREARPTAATGGGVDIDPYKGPMVVDASLLHALWCYGNLSPVEGVVYSYGKHQKCLDDADKLLFVRSAALSQPPANPLTGGTSVAGLDGGGVA